MRTESMIISQAMQRILREIDRIELSGKSYMHEGSKTHLANRLIQDYRDTDDSRVSELIARFMKLAGPVWQKKLLSNGPDSTGRSIHFSTLDEYLALIRRDELQTF